MSNAQDLTPYEIHERVLAVARRLAPEPAWDMLALGPKGAAAAGVPEGTYTYDRPTKFWSLHR